MLADAALHDIAVAAAHRRSTSWRAIKGVGPAKLEQYGAAFLAASIAGRRTRLRQSRCQDTGQRRPISQRRTLAPRASTS